MTRAALALGANLGESRAALRDAVASLATHPGVTIEAVSGLWQTAAVGGPEQPDYLNAVVLIDTGLDPAELLAVAQSLERAAGRRRGVRWGPRTLDVDLLDVGGVVSADPELTLPHPRAHLRAFVLRPWAQVDPQAVLAPAGQAPRTVQDWVAAVAVQAVEQIDPGMWWR